MTPQQPYLSVVAASRNDDHGKNLHRRMQIFVNGFFEQCHRFQLPAELIMVDWNPPPEKSSLADALSWPVQDAFCSARIIQVPPEIHNRFKHSEALPLFQMIAKNVGIRRAKGEFILATNIDILLNDALMQYISERRLKHGIVYRINRYDAAEDVPLDATIQEQLTYCDANLIRVNAKGITFPTDGKVNYVYKPPRAEQIAGAMSVKMQHFYGTTYEAIFGNRKQLRPPETVASNSLSQHPALPNARSLKGGMIRRGKRFVPVSWRRPIKRPIKGVLALLRSARYRLSLLKRPLLNLYSMVEFPHMNACGDFTLMACEHWFALQGYPEYEMYSMHIDSVLLLGAWTGGIKEQVLYEPMRIYHIEHSSGSGWTPEGVNSLNQRLASAGIPQMSYNNLLESLEKMQKKRGMTSFNTSNWGLADQQLPEQVKSIMIPGS